MKNNGALIISLDLELLWGIFDKVDYQRKIQYFQNTRHIIPKVLKLFEQYGISCTWATVGMLFNENWEEWNENFPERLPQYDNNKLSPYVYGTNIQNKETEKLCFAPDLIRQILEVPGQELATHTYSHFYCLEPGQNADEFKSDLLKAKEMFKRVGVDMDSLVFPRNQFNNTYLNVCAELGISSIRSNPSSWYWKDTQKDTLKQKIFRTGDAYLGPNNKSYGLSDIEKPKERIISQKASRLLRPHSGNAILDTLKVKRIKNEMSKAAKHKELYHLWWHPHNYGNLPEKNLEELEHMLQYYMECRNKYGFESLNMNEVSLKFI